MICLVVGLGRGGGTGGRLLCLFHNSCVTFDFELCGYGWGWAGAKGGGERGLVRLPCIMQGFTLSRTANISDIFIFKLHTFQVSY